ncbi:MAG: hypothetical protein Q7R73_01260 [bacterium]|nr:hypothetical protein [bacterium]
MMLRSYYLPPISVEESEILLMRLTRLRRNDAIQDTLLIFEYLPAFAFHHWERDQHAIRDQTAFDSYRAAHNIPLVSAQYRGGGMMYHGPGQIVCAPVIKCRYGMGIAEYQKKLGDTSLYACKTLFGVKAFRVRYDTPSASWQTEKGDKISFSTTNPLGIQGAWVQDNNEIRKIGFLGFRHSAGVLCHGFALNLYPGLEAFRLIDPCNLSGINASSVERISGIRYEINPTLAQNITALFSKTFNYDAHTFQEESLENMLTIKTKNP